MRILPVSDKGSGKSSLIKGQALLVVLLSMSVVLAVVLSSVSKSVTDITITTYEEDSLRAFSAAEAGIEEALLESVVPGDTIPETKLDASDPADPRYEAEVNDPDAGGTFEYPDKLTSGEVGTFWFVSHDNNGNMLCAGETCTSTNKLEICWTNEEDKKPAVEIAFYYDKTGNSYTINDYSSLEVKRFNFDPISSRATSRNFIAASNSCDIGDQYAFSTGSYFNQLKTRVDGCVQGASKCLIAARVRMLDNGDVGQKMSLKVRGGGAVLPPQGVLISSTGTSGDSTRKVTVLQGYPEPPNVFEGVLFSGRELTQ